MLLMMYIGDDFIEAVPVDKDKIPEPGYLGNFKRCLKAKYKDLITQYGSSADFLVINNIPAVSVNLGEKKMS
jgi:hypothetical protein